MNSGLVEWALGVNGTNGTDFLNGTGPYLADPVETENAIDRIYIIGGLRVMVSISRSAWPHQDRVQVASPAKTEWKRNAKGNGKACVGEK